MVAAKVAPPDPQPPPLEAADPLEALPAVDAFVELCSSTSVTPSISRRRWSVSATSDWLVVQPLIVKTGVLPGGVADVAVELVVALPAVLALDAPGPLPPTWPCREVSEASRGSTRPSSWKACDQSKRASTSPEISWTRWFAIAMKLVYGASRPA